MRRCPICQTEIHEEEPKPYRPFCSVRCKKIDLGNWLTGTYTLPREMGPEDWEELNEEEREKLFASLKWSGDN